MAGGWDDASTGWGDAPAENSGWGQADKPQARNSRADDRPSNDRFSNGGRQGDGGRSFRQDRPPRGRGFKRDFNSGGRQNDSSSWGESKQNSKSDQGNGWNDDNGGFGSSDKPQQPAKEHNTTDGWQTESSGWGDGASIPKRDRESTGWADGGAKPKRDRESTGWDDDGQRPRRDRESSGGGFGEPGKETKRFKNDDGEEIERPAPYKPEELNLEEEAQLQGNAGENFERYNEQKVTCVPLDKITPIQNFSDIIESKLLLTNVEAQKFTAMTPIQKWAMPAIMGGHDLIACAQTGSGKTAAFLLPILQTLLKTDLEPHDFNSDCQNPYCIIISPTRELANQIHVHATFLSRDSVIKCQVIYGGIQTGHLKAKISSGCHILVATPGRLKDFVERGWIGFKNIKYIILDEGDRLVDEGFTSDIRTFFGHSTMPPIEDRQTLFFSATFKEQTQLNAKEYLKSDFVFLTVGRIGAANENINQEFIQVSRENKKRELKKILSDVPETDKTIIFTQTKNAADMLAGFFNALKLSSTSIHGDRHQSQREQAIRAFKKGEKRFLISSPVGNRGLDLPKVALVINYDLPSSIDEYVHRIGRTGRAGHTGRAISFYDETRDSEMLPSLIEILVEAKQTIPDWMQGGTNSTEANLGGDDDDWGVGPSTSADTTEPKQSTSDKKAEDAWDEGAW